MSAGIAEFVIDTNADFTQALIWTDSSGNPINLTGYSATMSIANNNTVNKTIYYTLSSSGMSPGITFVPLQGIINLFIPASATSSFTFPSGAYDLLLQSGTGEIIRLLQGPIAISLGISSF